MNVSISRASVTMALYTPVIIRKNFPYIAFRAFLNVFASFSIRNHVIAP